MIKSIQLLDSSVIEQLRSSLVITTLPQCIKELINNAIDANATSIDISLDIEKFSLQVNDNGDGILNMNKIGQRHTTSKCHKLSDTEQLKTFGFRGEALASITNESLVQIISRHCLSKDTFEGFWRDGRLIGDKITLSKHTRKIQPGTTVIVRDLFYKFPVRRRYLSSYQYVVIMESVKRLVLKFALCFHHIHFNLIDSARNAKVMMIKKNMKYVDMHEDNINVQGFFSTRGYPNKVRFIKREKVVNNYFVPNDNGLYKIVSGLFSNSSFVTSLRDSSSKGKGRLRTRIPWTNLLLARTSIQKYPIYFIKLTCPDWSYYDIDTYLDVLSEFSAYPVIKNLVSQFTTQFLKSAGLIPPKRKENSLDEHCSKKRTGSTIIDHSRVSKYVQHASSSVGTGSTTNDTTSSIPNGFVSWWDDCQKKLYYIDPRTGNS
ncbi:hypothetical protein INT47_007820 [Mucor saturninus]|uniref:Uncharacterized protein n=1 Tax=Mucor saturninus TaxID=64648 RepID=A0A8H7RCM0_9FUNG|nr:hypothetical protein INT47_007820 [Mucor saturninus]